MLRSSMRLPGNILLKVYGIIVSRF